MAYKPCNFQRTFHTPSTELDLKLDRTSVARLEVVALVGADASTSSLHSACGLLVFLLAFITSLTRQKPGTEERRRFTHVCPFLHASFDML